MKVIENQRFGTERALYHTQGALLRNCRFEGEEDGESALKESSDIEVQNCYFDLRYPFWHTKQCRIFDSVMTEKCRAALWYDAGVVIKRSHMGGIKACRECEDVTIAQTKIVSPEFGWRCRGMRLSASELVSEYAFFESRDIVADGLTFSGKYSFQYTKDLKISHSVLNTKDAFWHAEHVIVEDSVINGEYLGWYSDGLTLVRCHIKGTQPFCYCKHLKLIDCTMEDADLCFEYSDVEAKVLSRVLSIKNPRSGRIEVESVGEIIRCDSVYPSEAEVVIGGKRV